MSQMNRRHFLASATAAATFALPIRAAGRRTKYLVLVTADGLRWQELFTGIDLQLMNDKDAGMEDAHKLREALWRPTAEARRAALLPYFWGTLAPSGVVIGNVKKGSSLQVTNRFHNSYPGYSELLTGHAQDDVIQGNKPIQNPSPSFLEVVKETWQLPPEQVAVFASWDVFKFIVQDKPGELFVNAGYADSPVPHSSRVELLNSLQKQALYIEDSARHDAFTFELAMEYLKSVKPRLFYVAFDEPDDWAHDKRYDRVLESIQYFDTALRALWSWLQGSDVYRGVTTLMVTCDHGRGGTAKDWDTHGGVPGDAQTWLAAIGPDTPARGELSATAQHFHRDIAPTALELLGMDYRELPGVMGKPITEVLR